MKMKYYLLNRKVEKKKKKKKKYLELENSKSFPVAEKIMSATSASQRTESSSAFFKSPRLLLEKVTCLAVTLSIFLILIFSLAILYISLQNSNEALHISTPTKICT
jgi:Fe2+ transport system protein B